MKKILLIITILCAGSRGWCQDFTFSQFYEMPVLRNPSLAGIFNGDIRVSAAHRSQWQSVTIPFQTSALGVEYKLPVFNYNDFVTIGGQMVYDVAGDIKLKRTQLLPFVNFHKSLSEDEDNYLSLAFMGGPVQSQFDPTQAKLDDQFVGGSYSPTNTTNQVFSKTAYSYWDASTGLTYSSSFGQESRFYVGVGMFHFNQPKVNFFSGNSGTVLYSKYTVNAGITTPTSEGGRIIAFADYFREGGNRHFLSGAIFENDVINYYDDEKVTLGLGAFYRMSDALVPVVRLSYYQWTAGLSYDINVSKLKTASQLRGGFELTASYCGFLNTRNTTADKVRCVRF